VNFHAPPSQAAIAVLFSAAARKKQTGAAAHVAPEHDNSYISKKDLKIKTII